MPLRILPKEKGRSFRNKRGSGGYGEDTRRENRLEELGRVDAEKAYTSRGKRNLRDEKHRIRKELKEGGSAKLTPAETRRKATIRDRLKDWKPRQMPKFPKPESKVSPGRPGGKGKESPDKRWNKGDKFMTPLRAKKAGGGAARKGTHPKGKTESSLKQSKKHAKTKYGVKDAFKPNYIPIRKREFRSWRNKKAQGGRIGLKHGGSAGAAIRGHGAEIK
jgi:hypothetical protein